MYACALRRQLAHFSEASKIQPSDHGRDHDCLPACASFGDIEQLCTPSPAKAIFPFFFSLRSSLACYNEPLYSSS